MAGHLDAGLAVAYKTRDHMHRARVDEWNEYVTVFLADLHQLVHELSRVAGHTVCVGQRCMSRPKPAGSTKSHMPQVH